MILLNPEIVQGIHSKTSTVLQTSRTNPFNYTGKLDNKDFEEADVSQYIIDNSKKRGLEAIIACGGDDTLSVIQDLVKKYGNSLTLIGIPKTMDGDLQVYSLGHNTAINRAKDELEDFIPLLEGNGAIGIIELFGRDVGRVAFMAGISAGADVILIPEIKVDLDYTCDFIADRYNSRAEHSKKNPGILTNPYVLISVSEGTHDPLTDKRVYLETGTDSFGHGKLGGIGDKLAKRIHDKLKDDPRIRSHISKIDIKTKSPTYSVRCGHTLFSDSYVGQKLGIAAVEYLQKGGESGMGIVDFNEDGEIRRLPIKELTEPRPVNMEVLKHFENSGLYCFGRKPEKKDYKPKIVSGK